MKNDKNLSNFLSASHEKMKYEWLEIENASLGKRMPFLLKLINSRGISLIFYHLCLASAILYVTCHVVNLRLGASRRGCTICEPARHASHARQTCEALRLA